MCRLWHERFRYSRHIRPCVGCGTNVSVTADTSVPGGPKHDPPAADCDTFRRSRVATSALPTDRSYGVRILSRQWRPRDTCGWDSCFKGRGLTLPGRRFWSTCRVRWRAAIGGLAAPGCGDRSTCRTRLWRSEHLPHPAVAIGGLAAPGCGDRGTCRTRSAPPHDLGDDAFENAPVVCDPAPTCDETSFEPPPSLADLPVPEKYIPTDKRCRAGTYQTIHELRRTHLARRHS